MGCLEQRLIVKNELTVFEDYILLDVLTKLKNINFQDAWKRRVVKSIEGVPVKFASLRDLIRSKQASRRKEDKEDVRVLKRLYKIS